MSYKCPKSVLKVFLGHFWDTFSTLLLGYLVLKLLNFVAIVIGLELDSKWIRIGLEMELELELSWH